jgi:hypothetical protein
MGTMYVSTFIDMRDGGATVRVARPADPFDCVHLTYACKGTRREEMEKIIVLFSVPIFLLIVLLIVVFVLANYSGDEPAKGPSTQGKASEVNKDENNVDA